MTVVIIPAYQPDKTLEELTDQLWLYGCRIVVVDDGSGKEYRHIFEGLKDVCIVLTHLANRGKGAAIKTALRYIENEIWDYDVIGVMDADGQHMTEDMMELSEFSRQHKDALALGVRSVGKEMPPKSRFGNQITRGVFRFVSGVRVSDTQTGLRAFAPELIPELLKVGGDRYEYEMNVLMAFAKAGIPIVEFPIHTVYLDKGNSNSHFHVFWDSVRIYGDILKFALSSFSSFVLDYILFLVLMILLPHEAGYVLLANIAARIASACCNYAMNCRFVFRSGKRFGTALGYFALAGVMLAMNSVILEVFVNMLHVPVYLAKLATECLLFLVSLLVQKCVIFRKGNGLALAEKRF